MIKPLFGALHGLKYCAVCTGEIFYSRRRPTRHEHRHRDALARGEASRRLDGRASLVFFIFIYLFIFLFLYG